ncbi:VOC family protein [Erythrobacter sp. Alg231-14]|uniref:VOC family protein n=1 Tax=Erythrobacter sp. Alg231-14 TaxID=1922225 RepID=UPI000D55F656
MNVIDHISVGVPSVDQARKFYDGLLDLLGLTLIASSPRFAAYGLDTIQFLVMSPEDGEAYSPGNGVHVCFVAPNVKAVGAFHRFALEHGGECAGSPGPRAAYPNLETYTCFVRDPFGNKLEAIHNGFSS